MSDGHVQWDRPKMTFLTPTSDPKKRSEEEEREQREYEEKKAREAAEKAAKAEEDAKTKHENEIKRLIVDSPFRPLNDRILVVPVFSEGHGGALKQVQTEAGVKVNIYRPDQIRKNTKRATNQAKVVAVGPGMRLSTGEFIRIDVEPGDEIIYEQFGFSEVEVDGVYCHVVRQEDILGKRV